MSTTYVFYLPDVTCVNCLVPIESQLNQTTAVNIEGYSFDVVSEDKNITIVVDEEEKTPEEVRQLLQALFDEIGTNYKEITLLQKILRLHWLWGFIGTGSGVTLLVLSLLGITLSLSAMIAVAISSVALTFILGAESYWGAAKKLLKTRTLNMDSLFALSTLTVIGVSIAAFFFPGLPMMFEASLLIFGFRHVGLGIERSIKQGMALDVDFKTRAPRTVRKILWSGEEVETPLAEIIPNNIISINATEVIPVDGYCEVDEVFILDTIVTGSTLPRRAVRGELLLAGMCVAEDMSLLQLRVKATAANSYLARLDKHIAKANFEKAPLETATQQALQYFIPAVILFALLSGVVISQFFPMAIAIQCMVSVLVSACPCTLGLITPLAVKIGMNKAAEHGVKFKSAKTLQEADRIDRVVFDLNGTLTMGVPTVRDLGVTTAAGFSTSQLLQYFALLEEGSTHLVGKAICDYARNRSIQPGTHLRLTSPDESHHSGISALINDKRFTVGNQSIMDLNGINTGEVQSSITLEDGDSVIYLAHADQVVGYLILSDPLRENARHAVTALQRLGKEVYICTGAAEVTALRYARLLGIPVANVAADRVGLSEGATHGKQAFINDLKEDGHWVAMIGDAGNDALAVTTSDFGIAIKSNGSDEATLEQAGALIESDSLLPVVSAFEIAQQTVSNIKQNLAFSLGYNILAMLVAGGLLLTIGVTLNPGTGVALMIFQSSLILLNAYRFQQQELNHLQLPLENDADYASGSYSLMHSNMPGRVRHANEPAHEVASDSRPIFRTATLESTVTLPIGCGYEIASGMLPNP